MIRSTALSALFLLTASSSALAQAPGTSEPDVPEKAGKELRALRVRDDAPRIDGDLGDGVWLRAPSIDDMVQNEPDNMAAPTERTVVQVAYDDDNIYVAARMFMRDPTRITDALGRRDTQPRSDLIWMSFDPRHDHLTAVVFYANPSGVQNDNMFFDDTNSTPDYNAVWQVETMRTEEGWNAEFRIPLSQFRFRAPDDGPMVWGFNVRRDIVDRGEFVRWIATPRGTQGFVSRFGHLIFDEPMSPPRRIELIPFAVSSEELATGVPASNSWSAGMDARIGLGTSATLSATANPDFGQVEQDPSVLNLSVFETFFPEKRPFFLEDSRTLIPPYSQFPLFHSRRIGQRPGRFALQPGDVPVSRPDETTILGAAKVTGKAGTWTYGMLSALTDREYATVDATPASGTIARVDRLIEPMTSHNVFRMTRDILGSSSTIGAAVTGVIRENDMDAFTGGPEYNLRWRQNRFNLNGSWVGTRAPIGGVMRDGFGGATNFSYNSRTLGIFGHFDYFDRNFKNTDIGFFRNRNNKNDTNWGVNFIQPDPTPRYRSRYVYVGGDHSWSNDGLLLINQLNAGFEMQFLNFWYAYTNAGRNFSAFDDLDTRGGPSIVVPGSTYWNAGVNTDSRKPWTLSTNANASWTDAGGWSYGANTNLRVQPSPRTQASLNLSYTMAEDAAQWITNTDVDGDGQTDHVYGRLDRHVVSVTGRTTYAFTRDMTLEAYMQPFVAVGDYSDIRRLAAPKSYDFSPATIGSDPDFNVKSLRTNVVYRWEYRPGSTLFVVWSMSTADASRPGDFSPFRDIGSAFSADGTHVFAVKLTYWLGL